MAALTLLITSPRMPAGLMSRDAWRALESADAVLARDPGDDVPAAVAASGVSVEAYDAGPARLARELIDRTASGDLVWIGSPDADPGLTDALAQLLTAEPDPPRVEVLVGSWDPPGARLLDSVAVMDALRSPGGDPWSAQQTHRSLANYLIEEAYETVEVIESDDHTQLAEELGDVLFQVLFHSRAASEDPDEGFDIDDVAAGLVDKLVRRNPHVFGDRLADHEPMTAAEVETAWEHIKADEKPSRETDLSAGIPVGLSSLLAAEKVLTRAARRGMDTERDLGLVVAAEPDGDLDEAEVGRMLMVVVERARRAGLSADTALRAAVRQLSAVRR